MRSANVSSIEAGKITEFRRYFDRLGFTAQPGLGPGSVAGSQARCAAALVIEGPRGGCAQTQHPPQPASHSFGGNHPILINVKDSPDAWTNAFPRGNSFTSVNGPF